MQRAYFLSLSLFAIAGCGTNSAATDDADVAPACVDAGITEASRFPTGDAVGARDLFAGRAAKQARAGRLDDAKFIVQRPDPRQQIRLGDYLLINDKIAAYIEAPGLSDGYLEFGGEILALDRVGDDGRPLGKSTFGETMLFLSRQAIKADNVSVLNDGSDGKAAIVRASGLLTDIPFLGAFEVLFRESYGIPAAIDYVLEPGSEVVKLRLSLMNNTDVPIDLTTQRNVGFFQTARQQMFADVTGYDAPKGKLDYLAFDGGDVAFAVRAPGQKLNYFAAISGFVFAMVPGFPLDACGTKTVDYAEYVVGGPDIDGALAAMRRADHAGVDPWRTVTGSVLVAGAPVPAAKVHARGADGAYLTRATADDKGHYAIRVPAASGVTLSITAPGYAIPAPTTLTDKQATADLSFAQGGYIDVNAQDTGTLAALPVRVQVIPQVPLAATPAAFGVEDEPNGRVVQEFAVTGRATIVVPPGVHRVLVSRGFEWEIFDKTVSVAPGQGVALDVGLRHTVDSTGVMCADFHIHSHFSADSSDEPEIKVKSAIADGLEIPVSSEHEWIIDFQPIIEKLGLTKWAYGFPSEEFTTFTWGHFGIIPIRQHTDAVNNGAIPWIGRTPPQVFHDIAMLPEKPVMIVNHPSGQGFTAYFSSVHFNRATAAGDAEMWSDEFGAVEVFNASDLDANRDKSVADWFALLNAGKVRWAVGNSDSHSIKSTAVGYPRTCFRFGHDDPTKLSPEAVRDELARGNGVVSGGLLLDVKGPNGEGPGATIKNAGGMVTLDVVVQAPTWLEAKLLEVFVDGETVDTIQLQQAQSPTGANRYEAQVKVTAPKNGQNVHWVVLHASNPGATLAPLLPNEHPFAVSNPIFF